MRMVMVAACAVMPTEVQEVVGPYLRSLDEKLEQRVSEDAPGPLPANIP